MAIFSPTTPVLRGIQPDIAPRDPVGLLGGRLAEAISDILDQQGEKLGSMDLHPKGALREEVLDLLDWVDEFDITSPSRELLSPDVPSLRSVVRFTDYWMNEARNQLSGYDANEGALYVLFMLVLALHPRMPRFFAVDCEAPYGKLRSFPKSTSHTRLSTSLLPIDYRIRPATSSALNHP